MTLFGMQVGNNLELNKYKKGSKKTIITSDCSLVTGDGIVLFNRTNKVACVLRVNDVNRSGGHRELYTVETIVLNPEDQDISIEYFGYTGVVGLRFIGYAFQFKKLKLTPKE